MEASPPRSRLDRSLGSRSSVAIYGKIQGQKLIPILIFHPSFYTARSYLSYQVGLSSNSN